MSINYWYQYPQRKCVIYEYGRYEAVHCERDPKSYHHWTWVPVLAGPVPDYNSDANWSLGPEDD